MKRNARAFSKEHNSFAAGQAYNDVTPLWALGREQILEQIMLWPKRGLHFALSLFFLSLNLRH